jgi:predicted nucleic acid-binding protein
MPPAAVDTCVLYAIADCDDAWHDRVKAYLQAQRDTLIVPVTVLPEACYLFNTYIGQDAERQLLISILQGEMQLEGLTNDDLDRTSNLLQQFADANIGFVDATLVAIAERRRISRILTTDRRHFAMIRPHHCPFFELLP